MNLQKIVGHVAEVIPPLDRCLNYKSNHFLSPGHGPFHPYTKVHVLLLLFCYLQADQTAYQLPLVILCFCATLGEIEVVADELKSVGSRVE